VVEHSKVRDEVCLVSLARALTRSSMPATPVSQAIAADVLVLVPGVELYESILASLS